MATLLHRAEGHDGGRAKERAKIWYINTIKNLPKIKNGLIHEAAQFGKDDCFLLPFRPSLLFEDERTIKQFF